MDEVSIITDYIQDKAGLSADLIWGNCIDENLGDKISVTIIATGFQTTEQREKDKQNVKKISLLTPEEAPLVKPVEPVNSFITPKEAPVSNEPVLKVQTEEAKQPDLFGDLFNIAKPAPVAAVPAPAPEENGVVFHQLVEEEVPQEEPKQVEEPAFQFEVKVAETEFVFETPVATIQEEIIEERPVAAAPVETYSADQDKTDESIEEQLRKSKERILRLKDLSMKLRTTNGLQELENVPAYQRKQMQLQQIQHSSESQVSRFTLTNDEDGETGIRPNNSFLHDNVD